MQIPKCVTRFAIFALVGLAASPVMAQLGPRNFSPYELEQLGLEKMWSSQLPIDPHRSKIETFRQVVSLKNPMVVFEVEHDGRTVSFSSNELSPYGEQLGEEGAKARADQYVARLDTRKGEPNVVRLEVPEVTFLVQSSSGMLIAVDGRTGKTDWTQVYGNRGYPQPKPAANDDFVAVVNDFTLHCLRRSNGEIRWSKKLEGVPAAGPVMGEEFIYVPLLDGTILAYNFDGGPRLTPKYKSLGHIKKPMVASKTSIAWSTDRDYFYVGYADRPLVRYRIESSGQILAPPSTQGPLRLFFTTETGYAYCVYATDGSIQWRFSCGQPIRSSAIAIGDGVFVTLERGGMYKLGLEEGDVKWFVPRVEKFLSANEQYVYCLDERKNLQVLDINSGAYVGKLDLSGYDFYETNFETDRIILGHSTGRLVVLRSSANPYPMVHINVTAPGEKPASPAGAKPEAGKEDNGMKPAVDPFAAPPAAGGGGVADPFAAPGGGGGGAADPFAAPGGGSNDPFGGGGSGGGASDPFGGGSSDPFGGGSSGGASDPFGGGSSDPFGGGSDTGAGMDDPFGN